MNLTLRPARPEDLDALWQLDRDCYPRGIAYTRRDLRDFLTHPEALSQVAWSGKEIVGFLIGLYHDGQGHIITADVRASARRQGIASALLRGVESEMGARGVTVVELETATNNAAGIAFWKRSGYQIVAVVPRYYLRRIDAYLMFKRLRPSVVPADLPR